MADVFVSHSNYDKEKASLVAESLEAAGLTVWWDRTLKPGERLHTIVQQAMEDAKAIVVLWTAHSVVSDWVREEAEEARARHILVPLLMEDPVELPTGYAANSAARLHDWDGQPTHQEWQKVVDTVRSIVRKPVETGSPSPRMTRHGGRDDFRAPRRSLGRRIRSRLEGVSQGVSYVTALGTIFQAAARWEDTVNWVIDHAVVSAVCLVALGTLFASTLFQGLQLHLPRWRSHAPVKEPARPLSTPAASRQAEPPRWKRGIVAVGSLVTALGLAVVVVLLYLSTTGVHYVLIESASTYDQAVRRADEINRALENSGEVSRVRPQHPHFSNPNSAILVGPYFSRSAAEETLRRLKNNSSYRVRPDALVLSYSLTDAKEAAARFFGWKTR